MVSVICVTYNQKNYIRAAIDSLVNQKVDFEYEILIHDDASTDGTTEIVREYESRYPQVKCIYEEKNLYLNGIAFLWDLVENQAKGKYIALCDGDDFWIDEYKLQKQFDAMENHPECDLCACWGSTLTEDGKKEVSQIRPRIGDGILTVEETIMGGGQYLVTAGLFFRQTLSDDLKNFGYLDYAIQMLGAVRGGILYLDQKMAVYRRYALGSWTNDVLKNEEKLLVQWDKEKKLLAKFNDYTDGQYKNVIAQRFKAYSSFKEQLLESREEILKLIHQSQRPVYIWGLGRRGVSLESFLKDEGIIVDGVCDAINDNVGALDGNGNKVIHTDEVLKRAKTIWASTKWAYDDLVNLDINGTVLDFSKYMPYG